MTRLLCLLGVHRLDWLDATPLGSTGCVEFGWRWVRCLRCERRVHR